MKWGRKPDAKKATSSSSSSSDSSSVVSQVFTFSWVSKLKRFGSKVKSEVAKPEQRTRPTPIPAPDSKPEAAKPKGRLQPAPTPGPNSRSASGHLSFSPGVLDRMVAAGGGGEAPRRRSVGEDEGQLARARRCELFRSARHNSAGGELELAGPQTLGQLVSFSTRSRQWTPTPDTPSESGRSDSEPAPASHRRRRRRRPRSERRRGESGVSEETGQLPAVRVAPPPLKPIQTARSGGDPDRTEENLRRRSFSGKVRHRARPKVRVYSPRPAAAAVAAAERRRAAERESRMEESLAVVKRSRDPQRDFRESMVEMIGEKGIGRRPEELERLLACYLLLNSDEHHDLIVKVFRQVWFELNPARLDSHRSI